MLLPTTSWFSLETGQSEAQGTELGNPGDMVGVLRLEDDSFSNQVSPGALPRQVRPEKREVNSL